MFTGLIQDIGEIINIDRRGDDVGLKIQTGFDMGAIDIGASICCSGCCLTVVEKGDDWFSVDVSAESLAKTTIGQWDAGTYINLESSLKLGDELGGHFVFGHVDAKAQIESMHQDGDSWRITIQVPEDYKKYIASKGSVAIDGISLTVNEVNDASFGVNIIPHTWEKTTLSNRKPGDLVNLEIDMLARYVARMLDK